MSLAASDVSCYQAGLENDTCDSWSALLPDGVPDNIWYRFIITDGTKTVYYADNPLPWMGVSAVPVMRR